MDFPLETWRLAAEDGDGAPLTPAAPPLPVGLPLSQSAASCCLLEEGM